MHQYQRGKGAALRAGFAAAKGDIIVMIDADGSTDPREMDRFVEALEDGADFVKGSRHMHGGGSADFTWLRAAGNKMFVLAANALYGSRFTDLCYGYCAFWRRHVPDLGLSADGFEIETELVLGALKAGLEIREVPSYELERRAGTSNLNAARDGLRVLRTMLGRDEHRPDEAVHFTLRKVHLPSGVRTACPRTANAGAWIVASRVAISPATSDRSGARAANAARSSERWWPTGPSTADRLPCA